MPRLGLLLKLLNMVMRGALGLSVIVLPLVLLGVNCLALQKLNLLNRPDERIKKVIRPKSITTTCQVWLTDAKPSHDDLSVELGLKRQTKIVASQHKMPLLTARDDLHLLLIAAKE